MDAFRFLISTDFVSCAEFLDFCAAFAVLTLLLGYFQKCSASVLDHFAIRATGELTAQLQRLR